MLWNQVSIRKIGDAFSQYDGEGVLLGIDGIIDQVWQIVKKREGKNYFLFQHLKEFGQDLVDRNDGGISFELIKRRSSLGGFTANTGHALGSLGIKTTLLGMFGREKIDPHFLKLKEHSTLISLGDPVVANVYEFHDGKILLPHLENLLELDREMVMEKVGELKDLFLGVGVFSLGYWSNMPAFNQILLHFTQYFTLHNPQYLFFDPGNLTKRTKGELVETLRILKDLAKRYPITLSLNLHEAKTFHRFLGGQSQEVDFLPLQELLGLTWLVVHSPLKAILYSQEDYISLQQDLLNNPVRTTGAGDTFNAGLIAGHILKLSPLNRLALAIALARIYVQKGIISGRGEVLAKLEELKGIFYQKGGDRFFC